MSLDLNNQKSWFVLKRKEDILQKLIFKSSIWTIGYLVFKQSTLIEIKVPKGFFSLEEPLGSTKNISVVSS